MSENMPKENYTANKKDNKKVLAVLAVLAAIAVLVVIISYEYKIINSPDTLAWNDVKNGKRDHYSYLKEFPNGRYASMANKMTQQEKEEFERAKNSLFFENKKSFMKKYPNSPYKKEMEKILDDPQWVLKQNSPQASMEYLKRNNKDTAIRRKIEKHLHKKIVTTVVDIVSSLQKTKLSFTKAPQWKEKQGGVILIIKNSTHSDLSFFITENKNVFCSREIKKSKNTIVNISPANYSFAIVSNNLKDIEESLCESTVWFPLPPVGAGEQNFEDGVYVMDLETKVERRRR